MSEQRDLTATLVPVLTDDQSKISEFQSGVADAFKEALTDDSMSATLSLGVDFNEQSVENFINQFTLSVTAASEDFIKSIAAELQSVFDKLQEVVPSEARPNDTPAEAVQTNLGKIVEEVEKNTAALSNLPSELESITFTMKDIPQTETVSTDEPVQLLDSATTQAVLTAASSTTRMEDLLKSRVDVNAYFPPESQEQLEKMNHNVNEEIKKTAEVMKETQKDAQKYQKMAAEFNKGSPLEQGINNAADAANSKGSGGAFLGGLLGGIGGLLKSHREAKLGEAIGGKRGEEMKSLAKLDALKASVDLGYKSMLSAFNFGLEMFEKLWKIIQDASPMLQNILKIFDTAIQLILMPIGNKIAEMLIPSVLDIMDSIQEIWDEMDEAFEKDGLGGMIEVAVKYCLEIFFQKLEALIDVLMKSNTSWLKSIGKLLSAVETIMKTTFLTTFTLMVSLTEKLLSHLQLVLTTFGALLGAHYGLAVGQAIADGIRWTGLFGALSALATEIGITSLNPAGAASAAVTAAVIAALAGAAIGGTATYLATESIGLKDGGYVPATEGGEFHILAEGGEGEYVVPESKVEQFVNDHSGEINQTSRSDTYNIHINGYTDSELKSYITDVVDEKTSRARIRAGF